jgi:hypothetical protein
MNKYENLNYILSKIFRQLRVKDNEITLFKGRPRWRLTSKVLEAILGDYWIVRLGKAIEKLDLPLDELIPLGLTSRGTCSLTLKIYKDYGVISRNPTTSLMIPHTKETFYLFRAEPLNAWEKLTNLAENFKDEL